MKLDIRELAQRSGVKFGTSGARGLVVDMTDQVCFAYTTAFLNHLQAQGLVEQGMEVAVAGDYRPSSPRIMQAVGLAIEKAGFRPVHCGFVPTPAVAAYAMRRNIPGIMVTGSHIPDDRNGIKFYKPEGEILKDDEQGMCSRGVDIQAGLFDEQGRMLVDFAWHAETTKAFSEFVRRYVNFFPQGCLEGKRIGVYEHSSVARDVFKRILQDLGAEVVPLGRSDTFIPVDTEAVRDEDIKLARAWVAEHALDCIVSADGDGDRPLVSDEKGVWLRGDVLGIVVARFLGAEHVVTPVSSNSAVERIGCFKSVRRTRIGSPFVIEAMHALLAEGRQHVVGYEANGGFLLASDIEQNGNTLAALPTRDAVIVPLALLLASVRSRQGVSEIMRALPQRFTASGRLKDMPTAVSQRHIKALKQDMAWLEDSFGELKHMDETDGLRMTFTSGEVVHLRQSGNAPELRCYVEAGTSGRAEAMLDVCMKQLAAWK